MSYISVSTINNPEFINLQPLDISPLMSKCEIKVLYVGKNRNHSFISKDVAIEMSKTLRGSPIVGWYKEENEDFRDHGHQMTIDGDGIAFNCLTKPYGFVAPDAKVWFQTFEEVNKLGEKHEREYLMTEGYLWTGQFPECKVAVEVGRPQSMELEEPDGAWETDDKGIEFFIINDAMFSKLCILGQDVEPCFEGAEITAPKTTFSKQDGSFTKTLYEMMQQLNHIYALQGGKNTMEQETTFTSVEEKNVEFVDTNVQNDVSGIEINSQGQVDFVQTVESNSTPTLQQEEKEEVEKEEDKVQPIAEEVERTWRRRYSDLETQYSTLAEELKQLKNTIDNEKKDALIAQFNMLSEEDKADVINHKEEYSLDEIESKLSVICWRKKVNFDSNVEKENEKNTNTENIIYNLDTHGDEAPAFVTAMRQTKASRI